MSPEQRADAVLTAMKNQLGHACACVGPAAGEELCPCGLKRRLLIATAIKEAEDAAYERAILFCDGEAKAKDLPGDDPRFYAGRREAGRRLVRLVRSLKSQEP